MPFLEVLYTPADFTALSQRSLDGVTTVVFDVLRATSSMITALANGAEAVVPVSEIADALTFRHERTDVLLAGERDGLRISAEQTGSLAFDLGNSPREFTVDKVKGRTIVMTTTNGTRALRACRNADAVFVGSFLNLSATASRLLEALPDKLVIVCSGTFEEAAYEDVLAAGALCERVWSHYAGGHVSDAALLAHEAWKAAKTDLPAALARARNGQRLLSRPELAADLATCARLDAFPRVALMRRDGVVVSA